MNYKRALTCKVSRGELVIRIGIETLAFCATAPAGPLREFDEKTGEERLIARVTDNAIFARDVANELMHEKEDGSTPLGDLIDKSILRAVENGSAGVDHK